MAGSMHEFAAVTSVLQRCPDVDVISVDVDSAYSTSEQTVRDRSGQHVEPIVLNVHVQGWAGAARLAEALRLTERPEQRTTFPDTYGSGVWDRRRWMGWCADASRSVPVQVEVHAAELCRVDSVNVDPVEPSHSLGPLPGFEAVG